MGKMHRPLQEEAYREYGDPSLPIFLPTVSFSRLYAALKLESCMGTDGFPTRNKTALSFPDSLSRMPPTRKTSVGDYLQLSRNLSS